MTWKNREQGTIFFYSIIQGESFSTLFIFYVVMNLSLNELIETNNLNINFRNSVSLNYIKLLVSQVFIKAIDQNFLLNDRSGIFPKELSVKVDVFLPVFLA